MSSEPLVSCRALSKTYLTASGGIEALRSVDAEFPLGAVTALVGASGSGKSTLLRAIAGLDRPTSGQLLVDGHDLAETTSAALRRHRRDRVSYISQKPADNFIPHLTLAEHAHEISPRARELLVEVGLAHRLDSRPIELSGGEQARGAFALALARGTRLVIIDEPTAELDGNSAEPLLKAITRQAGTGVALVIATHDPDVIAIADRVLRLDRGKVITEPETPTFRDRMKPTPDESGERVLEAHTLGKTYRRGNDTIHAVRDATFALRHGDLGVLLGRSGSGKSTLLTLLAGWQQPDSGQILRNGRPITADMLRWSELGYLPQRFGLIPELSVRENIELPARLTGRRSHFAQRLAQLLTQFGLDELASRSPTETSIGQQQRTALARALLLQPALLIADEPTSHQDAGWRDSLWRQLAQIAQEGTTCLIATHEDQAANFATRLWHMNEGTLDQPEESRPRGSR